VTPETAAEQSETPEAGDEPTPSRLGDFPLTFPFIVRPKESTSDVS